MAEDSTGEGTTSHQSWMREIDLAGSLGSTRDSRELAPHQRIESAFDKLHSGVTRLEPSVSRPRLSYSTIFISFGYMRIDTWEIRVVTVINPVRVSIRPAMGLTSGRLDI